MELDPATFRVTARPLGAIIAKLLRERTRLNTMQGIAGTRAVVPTLDDQEAVRQAVLKQFKHCSATIAKDSREDANKYGYRAIHFAPPQGWVVYKGKTSWPTRGPNVDWTIGSTMRRHADW
jgi:hypothetical protein